VAKRRKKRRKAPNCGNGPHHEVSPMGHATKTKTKKGRRRKADEKRKQKGWGYPW
jgi:hypothetical protein